MFLGCWILICEFFDSELCCGEGCIVAAQEKQFSVEAMAVQSLIGIILMGVMI